MAIEQCFVFVKINIFEYGMFGVVTCLGVDKPDRHALIIPSLYDESRPDGLNWHNRGRINTGGLTLWLF